MVLAEPKLRMSTSSEAGDETGAASSDPCEWGRRAAAAPMWGWSAVIRTENGFSLRHILHVILHLAEWVLYRH